MNNELNDIKIILSQYKDKIKNDEKKLIEMNTYIQDIRQHLAKQKNQLKDIYDFVNNYGLLMKRQDENGISPTLDQYLGSLEQIKHDLKKLI